MSARLKALLADTLFKRLFALMWLALVISHAVAFLVVTRNGLDAGGRWPTFPSLPPFSFTQRAAPTGHAGASAPHGPTSGARMPTTRRIARTSPSSTVVWPRRIVR